MEMATRLGLRKDDEFKLLGIGFPLFEYDEENNRWVAVIIPSLLPSHHRSKP
jgi:aspartyl-tRNA synthetase